MQLRHQFRESRLHRVAHDKNDFVDAGGMIEPRPGVCHDGATGHFQEKLVHVRPHAGAFAGGDDDGAVHGVAGCRLQVAGCRRKRGLVNYKATAEADAGLDLAVVEVRLTGRRGVEGNHCRRLRARR